MEGFGWDSGGEGGAAGAWVSWAGRPISLVVIVVNMHGGLLMTGDLRYCISYPIDVVLAPAGSHITVFSSHRSSSGSGKT